MLKHLLFSQNSQSNKNLDQEILHSCLNALIYLFHLITQQLTKVQEIFPSETLKIKAVKNNCTKILFDFIDVSAICLVSICKISESSLHHFSY